jgi:hypothetical protein
VSQSKIKDKTFVKYFTKEYFDLDKDFIVPYELAKDFNFESAIVIPKGKYAINEEDGKIVVRFKI